MTLASRETIFALATAAGRAGVAVFRISGPQAFQAIERMTKLSTLQDRRLMIANVYFPTKKADINLIDKGMVVSFRGPHSFTGEDVVEFHMHGSVAVSNRMLQAFGSLAGFRLAERGEFCKRAWMNGKMNLLQTEALADLLDAQTEMQRKSALDLAGNRCIEQYKRWSVQITEALATVEACIDFSEDQSLDSGIGAMARENVAILANEMKRWLERTEQRSFLRNGFKVVIVGPTNAGKSSLINTIAQKRVSIVSPVPGTTRDVVTAAVDLNGFPVVFCDTAGLRNESADEWSLVDSIEREGIQMAKDLVQESNLVICLLDAGDWHQQMKRISIDEKKSIVVINKIDVLTALELQQLKASTQDRVQFYVSCLANEGIDHMCQEIGRIISTQFGCDDEIVVLNQRQIGHLRIAIENLNLFLDHFSREDAIAVAAEHLRMALEAIGNITGFVETETMLGLIFNRFCIGK